MDDGNKGQAQFPRLAISDLIVLTLSVAFTMASIAPSYQEALHRQDMTAWDVAPDLLGYLSIGICLFGLIVLARQRWRQDMYPLSPGHWVLVVIGPYSVLALMALWIRPLLWAYVPGSWSVTQPIDCTIFILALGISIAVSMPAMRALERRWCVCLLLIFLWLIAMILWLALDAAKVLGYRQMSRWSQHFIAISSTFEILAAAMGAVAMTIDAAKRTRRDWLHYFGVAALVLDGLEVSHTWGKFSVKWWRELFFHLLP